MPDNCENPPGRVGPKTEQERQNQIGWMKEQAEECIAITDRWPLWLRVARGLELRKNQNMAIIDVTCRMCQSEYQTGWPEGYKRFCSVGCEADFLWGQFTPQEVRPAPVAPGSGSSPVSGPDDVPTR